MDVVVTGIVDEWVVVGETVDDVEDEEVGGSGDEVEGGDVRGEEVDEDDDGEEVEGDVKKGDVDDVGCSDDEGRSVVVIVVWSQHTSIVRTPLLSPVVVLFTVVLLLD